MADGAEDYLARNIMDRRRRMEQGRRSLSGRQATEVQPDADDLRPLMRHALRLWIFIGWAALIVGAIGTVALFAQLAGAS